MGCCFEVMKELGPGFLERVYPERDSKIGILTRRRPEFESGEAGAEAAQLE